MFIALLLSTGISVSPSSPTFLVPAAPPNATQLVVKTTLNITKRYQLGVLGDDFVPGIVVFNAPDSYETRDIFLNTTRFSHVVLDIPSFAMIHYPGDNIIDAQSTTSVIDTQVFDIDPLDFQTDTLFGCRFTSHYQTQYVSGFVATRELKFQSTIVAVSFQ